MGDEMGGGDDVEMEMEEMFGREIVGRGMIGRRGSEGRSTGPCSRGLVSDLAGGVLRSVTSSSSALESNVKIGNIRSKSHLHRSRCCLDVPRMEGCGADQKGMVGL